MGWAESNKCSDSSKDNIFLTMPPKIADKLTDAEKKRIKQDNKAKANPEKAAGKKLKNDACREKRKEAGSSKSFS